MEDNKWYVIYTKSRWEKKVADKFGENEIRYYLPLWKVLKQWSDRKKWVEEPLFRSYIFVYIEVRQFIDVLSVNGVSTFVKFEGKPAVIQNQQIEAVKYFLSTEDDLMPNIEDLEIGDEVEVKKGPLTGLKGQLVNFKGKHKVIIEIEAINEKFAINVPHSQLKRVN